MNINVWISESALISIHDNELSRLFSGQYVQIGNIVNNRRMIRFIIDDSGLENNINILRMYGKNPAIIAIQLPDGIDYNTKKYPKNRQEFNSFMNTVNYFNNGLQIFTPAQNTAAGWEPFII
jgi:hypothetical protein